MRGMWLSVGVAGAALLGGCAGAPTVYIAGSYFPAWLVSVLGAIVLTVLLRVLLIRSGVDDALPARLAVYVSLTLALTFAALLFFFE
ncbi:YtcA family lipoprotein [Alcaligenes sp. SDU_A2]|uniref:YtcA family lipoprotein n=1 Tax=Alcaligenes sp. SDU_A2 TaxID=3136634 RepID=UPI002CC28FFA|nr:YtcA family lipoprotein [Alcaligenes sp.]HRL26633.1 YtcA family lipoprotein [Alcaligenes sp.]